MENMVAYGITSALRNERLRNIPFFNHQALFASDERQLIGVVEDVLRRGAFILQRDLVAFEAALASFLNVKHVFGVADGTNALILGLRAIGVGPGDEVILPSHTCIASAASIYFVGAKPVLVDVGPDRSIDPAAAARAITPRTRAIMPVQLNGRCCDMGSLIAIAQDAEIAIVEDAAQALGACYKSQPAGTFGQFGAFSFYPSNMLGCFGDGGAIVTNDDTVATQVRLLRDHGRNAEGRVIAWGTNSRLDNMQAAVLLHKFAGFKNQIAHRRHLAGLYGSLLADVADIALPAGPNADADRFDIYQNFEIEAEDRDMLRAYLKAMGIETLIQWGGTPVHQHHKLGFDMSLPVTERFFTRCLMLPMNTALEDADVIYVANAVRSFFGRAAVR